MCHGTILLDKIDNLENVGDVVRCLHMRNYLFPKGLAVRSSKRNIAFVEEKRKNIELKIAKEEQASQVIFDSLKNVEILMRLKLVRISYSVQLQLWICKKR